MSPRAKVLDFKYLDILSPRYNDSFIPFEDVPVGHLIRLHRSWRRKIMPNIVVEMWGMQPLYQTIDKNKFVFVINNPADAAYLTKKFSIPNY